MKYIKVDWPQCQEFDRDEFKDDIYWAQPTEYGGISVFVPEHIYDMMKDYL